MSKIFFWKKKVIFKKHMYLNRIFTECNGKSKNQNQKKQSEIQQTNVQKFCAGKCGRVRAESILQKPDKPSTLW